MVALAQAPPMFVCGGDPFWDDELVAEVVPMVTCSDCGWSGFAGSPELGEVEEAAEERASGGFWPDPTFQYADNHTEVFCRAWRRDHAVRREEPGQGLSPKQKRAVRAYRRAHEAHPAVRLQQRGDGQRFCPRCGFVP